MLSLYWTTPLGTGVPTSGSSLWRLHKLHRGPTYTPVPPPPQGTPPTINPHLSLYSPPTLQSLYYFPLLTFSLRNSGGEREEGER